MSSRRRICVFCASGKNTPAAHITLAEQFGIELARKGFDLVWGGCDAASMGAIARGVQAYGGEVVGVIPKYMQEQGLAYEDADELVIVDNLLERKLRMKELAHGFAVLPGGVGTLDEFVSQLAEAVIEVRSGVMPKRIAVLDWQGFYADLESLLENLYVRGFADPAYRNLYRLLPDTQSVLEYLKKI